MLATLQRDIEEMELVCRVAAYLNPALQRTAPCAAAEGERWADRNYDWPCCISQPLVVEDASVFSSGNMIQGYTDRDILISMTKESRDFEEIAASIKRALEPREDVKVVPHARVRDAVTNRMRDFDIIIEATVAGTPFRVGVECRRKARAVDKPQIEAFVTKLRDCRVDKGVFVSSSGFTDEALTAAEHHSIVCCHLTKVDVLPWIQLFGVVGRYWSNFKFHGDVNLVMTGPQVNGIPVRVEFSDGSRPPMPFSDIGTYIVGLQNVAAGHHRRRIIYEPSTRPIAVMPGEVRREIVRIELDAEFDAIDLEPKIEHWLYARAGDSPSAGMTKVHLGDIDGKPLTLEVTATAGKSLPTDVNAPSRKP